MIIRVTQKHIREARKEWEDHGEEDLCAVCPVARAIHQQTGMWDVRVYGDEIVDGHFFNDDAPRAHVPRSVKRFINAFDSKKKVKPFNFKVVWE